MTTPLDVEQVPEPKFIDKFCCRVQKPCLKHLIEKLLEQLNPYTTPHDAWKEVARPILTAALHAAEDRGWLLAMESVTRGRHDLR